LNLLWFKFEKYALRFVCVTIKKLRTFSVWKDLKKFWNLGWATEWEHCSIMGVLASEGWQKARQPCLKV